MAAVDVDCMACIANLALAPDSLLDWGNILDRTTGVTHAAYTLNIQRIKYRACELEWDSKMSCWHVGKATSILE